MLLLFGSSSVNTAQINIKTSASILGDSLNVARYSNDGTRLYEMFDSPKDIGVRWALPGGIQRIEVTVRSKSRQEAFNRYRYNIGDQIVLFDDYLDMPIARGWIYESKLSGLDVTYICGGAWKHHNDILVTTQPIPTDNTDEYLVNSVLPMVFGGAMNVSNIISTGIPISNYELPTKGKYPDEIIPDLLKMGDTSSNILDYWTNEPRFNFNQTLNYPNANLQPRYSSTGRSTPNTAYWRVNLKDISTYELSRNAWNMRNNITIYYADTTTLSANASGGATSITVTNPGGFSSGYKIEVSLDSGETFNAVVDTVSGFNVNFITKIPGMGVVASTGNLVRVTEPLVSITTSDPIPVSNYWERQYAEDQAQFDSTQAQNYSEAMLTALSYPANENSFSIGGFIWDAQEQKWPIWRLLTHPGIIEIRDLSPDGELFNTALDRLRSFNVVALDYDHTKRIMRVTPDAYYGEQRLDVILQQLGARVGQSVGRT